MTNYIEYRLHLIGHYIDNDGEIYCEKILDNTPNGHPLEKKTWSIYGVEPEGTEEWLADFSNDDKGSAEHLLDVLQPSIHEKYKTDAENKTHRVRISQTMHHVKKAIQDAYTNMQYDYRLKSSIEESFKNKMSSLGAIRSKLGIEINNNDGHVNIMPANLYTMAAVLFPCYMKYYINLPEEGETMLPNDVILKYTHASGCHVVPARALEFIKLDFKVKE